MSAATQNEMERLRKERDEHEQARTALEEALGQVMAERDAALEREQPLAAHVERIKAHARYVGHTNPEESITAQILSEGPTTSLARLKAEAAAEALKYASRRFICEHGDFVFERAEVSEWMAEEAAEYRRQAKGGER